MATIKQGGTAAMTIEIHTPELEALILQRMKSGGFRTVEEVLLQALKTPMPIAEQMGKTAATRTGADLIAALQASPYREIDIEPARYRVPVRDVAL
jgi:hypothetical protein